MTSAIAAGCLLITLVIIATFLTRPPPDDSAGPYDDEN